MTYSPFLSCREASRLITERLDRELGVADRIALALHLRICDACPKVVAQFEAMRRAMREWREQVEG